jgi:hypothetical protein
MMDNKNMVSEHKQLGFTISNDGNWGKHVDLGPVVQNTG